MTFQKRSVSPKAQKLVRMKQAIDSYLASTAHASNTLPDISKTVRIPNNEVEKDREQKQMKVYL